MDTIQGIPFFPIEFNKAADRVTPQQATDLETFLSAHPGAEVFVLCHGWNNNMAEARSLYEGLVKHMKGADAARLQNAAIMGVYWPSKKFTDSAQIPGGAASFDPAILDALEAYEAAVFDDIDEFRSGKPSGKQIEAARDAVSGIEISPKKQRDFAQAVIEHLPEGSRNEEDLDGSQRLKPDNGDVLIKRLASAPAPVPSKGGGAAAVGAGHDAGGAASLASFFGGIGQGARNLLNVTTYFAMKERAGTVGIKGLAPLLAELRQQNPQVRIHLVGHSFGGRLVTAAGATGLAKVNSVTLLQAAYSHYGIAHNYRGGVKDGMFRALVTNGLDGPIAITHTRNDKAVGLAYALASRIGGQVAEAFGGPDDEFGGMGANGAQDTPETVEMTLTPGTTSLAFGAGKVHNLLSDTVIFGHSEIQVPEVGAVIMSAAR